MAELLGGPGLEQKRKLVTAIPGPKSIEWAKRKQDAVSAGVGNGFPSYVEAAGGGIVVDVDGNQLIDLGAGIAVTSVGQSHPKVVAAVQEQVAKFTHTCFPNQGYSNYVEVCEGLNRLTPGDFKKTSVLLNSGAEAVENAIKIARSYTGKNAIVAFDHAFHGRTNLTMALTAKTHPYKATFGPFANEVYRVAGSYPYRDGLTGAEAAAQTISQIDKQVGAETVAAIIIEPIQGEGGFVVPAEGYIKALYDWAHENNILFIADEIQAGFARSGKMFAIEYEGIEPDIVTTAKGIAGGMPLSAVTARKEIMDKVPAGGLGGTYAGNPVANAAALAVMDIIEEEHLLDKALKIGEIIQSRFTEYQKEDARIVEVRGRGAMQAIELVKAGTKEPDAQLTSALQKYAQDNGIVLLTCGTYGNVVRFIPPLVISEELLNDAIDVLIEGLRKLK